MMGNNLQALKTARSISKQLAANKQHLSTTNDRQNDVNLPRKRANSESTRSDYGVTRSYTQLSTAAHGSGYLKDTSNGLPAMNDNRKHVGLATVVDNTSSNWNDNSFVYYSPGKSNTGAQEIQLKNYLPEPKREKRTAIDQSAKGSNNKKCPIVVDLTLDDSDDDDSGGSGLDAGGSVGSVSSAVGGTSSNGGSVGDSTSVGVNSGGSGVDAGRNVGSVSGAVGGTSSKGDSVGDGSRVGVNGNSSEIVSSNGSGVSIIGGNKVGGSGRVGVGSRMGVNDNSSDIVSSNGSSIGGSAISEVVVNGGGNRVGVSSGGSVVGKDGDDTISQDKPDTLPKILAAYSLNSGYPSFPELCNILSTKAKENVVKQNGRVVDGSAAIVTKGPNLTMVTESPLKNGNIPQPKNDVININQLPCESFAHNKNDVMNDVTNLRNEDSTKKLDQGGYQVVFSNWSVKHDSNLDTIRQKQGVAALPTDTGDQVIITKVVTSADKRNGRKHPRKTPLEVRKLYFEDKEMPSTMAETDVLKKHRKNSIGANKTVERPEKRSLEETIETIYNGNINGTPWSFTMEPDHCFRENKIRNLKARLAKQQEAVEKLRSKEKNVTTTPNSASRVLVVQIPDLKEKLGIQSEKKQSFRVIDQSNSFEDLGPGNKRKRKTLPRKVSREGHDDSDRSCRPQKRTRTRAEKETVRHRLPRRSRGRSNSPVVRKGEQMVPVVSKDLWHREMEKVEADLASTNRTMDKTAFLLFLGLKKVEAS